MKSMILRAVERKRIQPEPTRPLKGGVWVIGHRGFPSAAPENTLISFQRAIDLKVDMIEFDVSMTRDRVPIVIHDRTLERTTSGVGWVRKLRWKRMKNLDAGSWFSSEFIGEQIPMLDEVLLMTAGKVAFNIEIKMEAVTARVRKGVEEKVLEAIHHHGIQKQTVVSSFFPLAIRRIKRLDPNQSTALLLARRLKRDPRKVVERVKADAIHLPLLGLTRDTVELARSEGIPVRVFTVNEESAMKRLLGWGVNGLFTDFPDRLRKLVDRGLDPKAPHD